MIVMLAITIKKVEQSDYAVAYNKFTCDFNEPYEQGTYVTRVGDKLFLFQRTLQDLNVGNNHDGVMKCLTSDKVLIKLDVAIQIQLVKDSLISFVLKQFENNQNYMNFLVKLAESSILNTCILYTAEEYYSQRSIIDLELSVSLKEMINRTIGSEIAFFQLVDIQFPADYSNVILQKQTTQQQIITNLNDRANQLTNANTGLFVANNTANIMIINAQQQAQTIINKAITDQENVMSFWQKRTETFESLLINNFNNNVTLLIMYIQSEIIRNSEKMYSSL